MIGTQMLARRAEKDSCMNHMLPTSCETIAAPARSLEHPFPRVGSYLGALLVVVALPSCGGSVEGHLGSGRSGAAGAGAGGESSAEPPRGAGGSRMAGAAGDQAGGAAAATSPQTGPRPRAG